MEEEVPMHRAYPTQEGTSSQGGLPTWVLDLQESPLEIKQQQVEIIQTQRRHEEYMDRLGDLFYEQGKQHEKHGDYIEKLGDSYTKLYEQ